jgi:hypothetical protein
MNHDMLLQVLGRKEAGKYWNIVVENTGKY